MVKDTVIQKKLTVNFMARRAGQCPEGSLILEETGVGIDKTKLEMINVSNDIVEDAHFVTIGFLCRDFPDDPQVMEPDEITEWKWFELDKLPKKVFPPSAKVIRNYKENRFYIL